MMSSLFNEPVLPTKMVFFPCSTINVFSVLQNETTKGNKKETLVNEKETSVIGKKHVWVATEKKLGNTNA